MAHDPAPRLVNPDVSHQASDVSLGGILGFFALLVVAGSLIHALTGLLLTDLRGHRPPETGHSRPFLTGPGAPPPRDGFAGLGGSGLPIQQVAPGVEMEDLRAHETDILRRWGWQPGPDGLTLPVARALDALAADGQPVDREAR